MSYVLSVPFWLVKTMEMFVVVSDGLRGMMRPWPGLASTLLIVIVAVLSLGAAVTVTLVTIVATSTV
jgi:hypothetical protein